MLEYRKLKYKFIAYTFDSWRELKQNGGDTGEMGGLPIVHFGGETHQQTVAVLRAIG